MRIYILLAGIFLSALSRASSLKIVFIVDRSYSQEIYDASIPARYRDRTQWTQWDSTRLGVSKLAPQALVHGKVEFVFFGDKCRFEVLKRFQDIPFIFKDNCPGREGTNLYDALVLSFSKYKGYEGQVLFVLLSDGAPDFEQKKKICSLLRKNKELKILLVQVGESPTFEGFKVDLEEAAAVKSCSIAELLNDHVSLLEVASDVI